MFRNYLLVAWRNLRRNKILSLINITGLSIGLMCCMLIFLYAKDELSFDRFHDKTNELYRVTCTTTDRDGIVTKYGLAAMTQGPAFKAAIPEIRDFVRVQERDCNLRRGSESFGEKMVWADMNFFEVFSFPLEKGNAATVLRDLNSLVITTDAAVKYFGTTDVIGKTLDLEMNNGFETFIITGVAKNSPENSTIRFNIVGSFKYQEKNEPEGGWLWLSYPTFLVMNENVNVAAVEKKMATVYQTKAAAEIAAESRNPGVSTFKWGVQPFREMHLDKSTNATWNVSDPIYSYILTGIAIFILLIACINFINLTVAQSIRRNKEIGIRKVIGGQRSQLVLQFLGESFLLCTLAFTLAIVLAAFALPLFNELSNKRLSLSYLLDTNLVLLYVALFIVTGFIAGLYPAFVLSSFDPARTLQNNPSLKGRQYLSKSLVVVQFGLATFLIIATIFIYNQFHFLTSRDLGYNEDNLVEINVGRGSNPVEMRRFREGFRQVPGVQSIGQSMNGEWYTTCKGGGKEIDIKLEHIDDHYLSTLKVPLIQGRTFSAEYPSDSTSSVLVNEAFVKAAGWNSGLGKTIDYLNGSDTKLTIVGVVRDYHYESLKEKIKPQLFTADPKLPWGRFMIRLNGDNSARAIAGLEKVYREIKPSHPFTYQFADDINARRYDSEARWKKIIALAAILTIFISCIGLSGLASLAVHKRTKEIGIRKVLGASVFQIAAMISRSYLFLVLIAFLLAVPAAWFAANKWLEQFAYRIPVGIGTFAVAITLTILIAIITLSIQAIRAGASNPVRNLRNE